MAEHLKIMNSRMVLLNPVSKKTCHKGLEIRKNFAIRGPSGLLEHFR